jgi:hypothetical protein
MMRSKPRVCVQVKRSVGVCVEGSLVEPYSLDYVQSTPNPSDTSIPVNE